MKLLRRCITVLLSVLLFASALIGKEAPEIVMYWPTQDRPSVKITFKGFQQLAVFGGKRTLLSEVIVQNVSDKPIPRASFTVYLLDKEKVRVGNGILGFDDLAPSESTKVQFQCETVGLPASLMLSAHRDAEGIPNALKIVPLKIVSVPAGAKLVVDGKDEGITPALVNLTVGTHKVDLSKDGFASASTPVDIKPDEMAGGSITIELGGLSQDTIELRDGTVLTGDAISLTLTDVVVRVNGSETKYDRNQVKKITLVERITTEQPAIVQPQAPASNKAAPSKP
jgi:hypothetical protein